MSENRFAVFEEIGDEVEQISVWMTRSLAQNHADGCDKSRSFAIYERHTLGSIVPTYQWIKLGFGNVEVGEGFDSDGVPALLFGKNGNGVIGKPTTPSRYMSEDEALAVVSFANVESLDVVINALIKCKADRFERVKNG